MSLELRPGKPLTFELKVKRPTTRPVEVYYLTSFSFVAKGSTLRRTHLGAQVVSAVQDVSPEAHSIGSGLFGDHQNLTLEKSGCGEGELDCKKVFSFSHFPSLEPPAEAPKTGDSLAASDAGLQALLQAVVCGDLIGWGQGTRLLVYVADHGFRTAGQTPRDSKSDDMGRCNLREDQRHFSRQLDYPSVAELAYRLTENNIQVIFLVTEEVAEKYKELSDLLPKSTVTVLPSDLRNIKGNIRDAYRMLASTLVVSHTHVEGLNISYASGCSEGQKSSVRGACSIPEKSRKFFLNVTVSSDSCLEPQSLHLQLLGNQDRLSVELKSACRCDCRDTPDPSFCSYSGNVSCGVCRSNPTERISGQFCECDNFSCPYYRGRICGGNGECACGECYCHEGFIGPACECSTAVDQCRSPRGSLCSNRGNCQCNKCICEDPYHGPFCETCPYCENDCLLLM
ncbi:hypothetical protein SKAU_G00231340 [Synaphobranchus kaupii]|uniref:Integrin beta n=1 Tax=Synaphobranchus kaupii TaxID=118154 RepID=A0A9Q1F5V4_SYNKA|nr:hypothetical protein SKAU_G00231340 [Synaphobranchus kaupii]